MDHPEQVLDHNQIELHETIKNAMQLFVKYVKYA
jgi:hypothetical protein